MRGSQGRRPNRQVSSACVTYKPTKPPTKATNSPASQHVKVSLICHPQAQGSVPKYDPLYKLPAARPTHSAHSACKCTTLTRQHYKPATLRNAQLAAYNAMQLNTCTIRRLHPFPLCRFHVLLHSLFKVLCNFPSQYLFAIGLVVVFSLR